MYGTSSPGFRSSDVKGVKGVIQSPTAEDWKTPPPATGVRDTLAKYDPKDPAKSFVKICEGLIEEGWG